MTHIPIPAELRKVVVRGLDTIVLGMVFTGCSLVSPPLPTVPPGATIDCGNLADAELCRTAVQVAITAQRNPPAISKATVHRLVSVDECLPPPPECIGGSVFVTLQSGDTLQKILLAPGDVASGSNTGWKVLDDGQ